MKSVIITLSCLLVSSCGIHLSQNANSSIATNSDNRPLNSISEGGKPTWPYPDWSPDGRAAIQNGKSAIFKPQKLTEITLSIPADWEQVMAMLRPTIVYKSPTVDSRFANLMIQSSDTKPAVGYPVDSNKNFDYSSFEPEVALKHFEEKKTNDPASGRTQMIVIDGVRGVLEQVIVEEKGSANSSTPQKSGVWHWTTFMKAKNVNNKVDVIVVYPSSDIERYRGLIAEMINSIQIKRQPGVTLIETRPN